MILPLISVVAPLTGMFGLLFGSIKALEVFTNMNVCLVAINYPLTLLALAFLGDHWLYFVTILLLIVNKIILGSAAGKVRFFLRFPNYAEWSLEYETKVKEVYQMLRKERKEKSLGERLLSQIGEGLAVRVKRHMKEEPELEDSPIRMPKL